MSNLLHGQSAVITGGGGGIGAGIARALAARGCRVLLAGRNANRLNEAARQVPNAVVFPECDVRIRDHVDALFDAADRQFGTIDLLIASAGIGGGISGDRVVPDPVHALGESDWDEQIDTNVRGMFYCFRAAAQRMIPSRSGQIVNVSSARGALRGQAFGAGYCASKMAVRAMVESLGEELMPLGIRAYSILPDAVDTSLIAGTNLATRGALTPDAMGALVAELVTLPDDIYVDGWVYAPNRPKRKKRKPTEQDGSP